MTEDTPAVSDLTLERFRLNELGSDDAMRIAESARTVPSLRSRLEALQQSDDDINARYPPEWMARSIRDRVGRAATPASGTSPWPWTSLAVAAAVGAVLVVALSLPRPPATHPVVAGSGASAGADGVAGIDRVKGAEAVLTIYRKSGAQSEQLADGDSAASGDVIRVAYRVAGPRFGVIVSIDGRGAVTPHLPVGSTEAPLLHAGSTVLLDSAYELDNAPGWEQFYLVTGEKTFDVGLVLDAARRATAGSPFDPPRTLPLPAGLGQSAFLLRKFTIETRPR